MWETETKQDAVFQKGETSVSFYMKSQYKTFLHFHQKRLLIIVILLFYVYPYVSCFNVSLLTLRWDGCICTVLGLAFQDKILIPPFYSVSSGNVPPSWNACEKLGKTQYWKYRLQLLGECILRTTSKYKQEIWGFVANTSLFERWPPFLV